MIAIELSAQEKKDILSSLLKDRREALGQITQKIAADRIGVSIGAYQAWEGARTLPETEKLQSVALFLGISRVSELWSVLEGSADPSTIAIKPVEELAQAIETLPQKDLLRLNKAMADRLASTN